jgi:hypothetical protein
MARMHNCHDIDSIAGGRYGDIAGTELCAITFGRTSRRNEECVADDQKEAQQQL